MKESYTSAYNYPDHNGRVYSFEKHGIHEEINSPPFLIVVLAYFSF